jgi:hypothetical protein
MARQKWDEARFAKIQLEQSQKLAEAEKRARVELESVRARETELMQSTKGIVDDARKTIADLERTIAASDSASSGLLGAAKRAADRCSASQTPAIASGSASSQVPSGMSDGDRGSSGEGRSAKHGRSA